MYGDAADMGSSVASLSTLGSLCDELGAGYVGYYDSHVHCDWRASDLEPAFFAPDARLTSTQQGVWKVEPDSGPEGRFRIRWRALDERGQVIASATGSRWAPPRDTFLLEADVGGVKTLTTHHVTRP